MQKFNKVIGFVFLSLVLTSGCQEYGTVSKTAYDYSTAIYSACNLQSEERIEAVKQRLVADSSLSDREKKWLLAMVDVAEDGEWEQAGEFARRMMDEQVDGS